MDVRAHIMVMVQDLENKNVGKVWSVHSCFEIWSLILKWISGDFKRWQYLRNSVALLSTKVSGAQDKSSRYETLDLLVHRKDHCLLRFVVQDYLWSHWFLNTEQRTNKLLTFSSRAIMPFFHSIFGPWRITQISRTGRINMLQFENRVAEALEQPAKRLGNHLMKKCNKKRSVPVVADPYELCKLNIIDTNRSFIPVSWLCRRSGKSRSSQRFCRDWDILQVSIFSRMMWAVTDGLNGSLQ